MVCRTTTGRGWQAVHGTCLPPPRQRPRSHPPHSRVCKDSERNIARDLETVIWKLCVAIFFLWPVVQDIRTTTFTRKIFSAEVSSSTLAERENWGMEILFKFTALFLAFIKVFLTELSLKVLLSYCLAAVLVSYSFLGVRFNTFLIINQAKIYSFQTASKRLEETRVIY